MMKDMFGATPQVMSEYSNAKHRCFVWSCFRFLPVGIIATKSPGLQTFSADLEPLCLQCIFSVHQFRFLERNPIFRL